MMAVSARCAVLAALALLPTSHATRRQHFMQHTQRFTGQPAVPDLNKLQNLEEQFMSALNDHEGEPEDEDDQPKESAKKDMQEKLMTALDTQVTGSPTAVNAELKKIVDDMKKGIKADHDSAVLVLNDIMGAFSKCDVEKGKSERQLKTGAVTIDGKAKQHSDCRGNEKHAAVEKDECDSIMVAQQSALDASCGALAKLQQAPSKAADVCHSSGSEDYESWLKRNKEYFIKTVDEFAVAKSACEKAKSDLKGQKTKCQGFKTALTSQRSNCNTMQSEMESATCSYETERTSTCDGYGDCFENAKESYDKTTPTMKQAAENRKSEWRATKRIECLVLTFDSKEQKKAIQECIDKKHSTSQFDLKIADAPPQADCVSAMPLPCAGPFATLRFSTLPPEAQASTCTPCMINAGRSGDWAVVLKIGQDSQLGYSSALWENDQLLNEKKPVAELGNAKYQTYLDTPFKSIRMCIGAPDSNCVEHTFEKEWASAKELFSAGYIRDPKLDRDGILGAFAPKQGSYQNCPMQRPGFNVKCRDSNWVRFGFCLNCASQPCQNRDDQDADASIGVGLRGQSTGREMGAGWTNYFASGKGTCSPNSMTYKDAWVSVKAITKAPQTGIAVPSTGAWNLIMKIGPDSTFGFTSKYWTDDKLLNPTSPYDKAGNAKYDAFLSKPFNTIRMCVNAPDTNCVEHKFVSKQWKNAKALFSAGYIRDPTLKRDEMLRAFGPKTGSYQNCPMQRPGFNIKCNDNNWARFGFCLNCASQPCQNKDTNDADASIGVGLKGQSTGSQMGAGWTQYFASGAGTCSPNSMKYASAWLWVKQD